MNVSAFQVANFKAFAAGQRVPLRPITLVYGANSAGKSSLLHALALSHHAVETGDLDIQRTQIGGESIDLGGFRQFVHHHHSERPVQLGFELDPGCLSGRVAALLRSARKIVVELSVGEAIRSRHQAGLVGNDARDFGSSNEVHLERFSLEVDEEPLLSMSIRAGGLLRLDSLDYTHPVFRELFRGLLMLGTTTEDIGEEDFTALGQVLDRLVPHVTARQHGLLPRIEEEAEGSEAGEEGWELVPVSRGRRGEDLARAARLFLPRALRDLVDGLGSAIEDDIRRLRYLGPLRSYPPRHLAFAQHHDPNRFAGCGYAWDVVRNRTDVRRRVNAWLGNADRLKTPYELQARTLLPADALPDELAAKLRETLVDLVRGVQSEVEGEDRSEPQLWSVLEAIRGSRESVLEDEGDNRVDVPYLAVDELMDIEGVTDEWAQEIVEGRTEAIQDLVLIDKRSGTSVSHRDVGIGVSQVLPVLVSAFASETRLIAIEQPEIHLHPALQAELGDVFIESALGERGNTFLIETHSEHLLLRILRRVRETSEGELPKGVPAIRPEQVIVLYVQPERDGAKIIHIPITSDGEFGCRWPEGFFAERAKELF